VHTKGITTCISTKTTAYLNGYIINTKLNIIVIINSDDSAVNSVISQVKS